MCPEETEAPVSMKAAQYPHEDSLQVLGGCGSSVWTCPHVFLRPPQHRLAPVSAGRRGLPHMRAPWEGPGLRRPLRDPQALQETVQEAVGALWAAPASFQASSGVC